MTGAGAPGVRIRGGVGGTAVNVEELGELVGLVRRARHALDDARAKVRQASVALAFGADLAPVSAARASAALSATDAQLAALMVDVGDLGDALDHARAAYESAEEMTLDDLLALGVTLDRPTGGLSLLSADERIRLALAPLAAVLGWTPFGASRVTLQPAPAAGGSGDRPGGAPRGAADLVAGIVSLYPASGGPPGAVEVQHIQRPDGASSWVVLVPGTQSLALGGANPMDDASNVQAYVGAPSAAAEAVVGALEAAGARPGEPVLLAGHSLGGMAAMRVAASPAVRRRFRVTSVLTAGSPVGHMPTPQGVSVLHLEHRQDPVAALDVSRNPDHPGRVTLARVLGSDDGGFHDARAYQRTAGLADASTHPSVREWRGRAAEVLGGEGASVTRTVYVARRGGDDARGGEGAGGAKRAAGEAVGSRGGAGDAVGSEGAAGEAISPRLDDSAPAGSAAS